MGAQISSYDIAAGCAAVLVAIELFTPTKPFTSTARLLKQFRSQVSRFFYSLFAQQTPLSYPRPYNSHWYHLYI